MPRSTRPRSPICSARARRPVAAALVLTAAIAPAFAGGSAENAVLIINPASLDSMYVGNYYKTKRNIPDSNVLYIDPNAANYTQFSGAILDGFLGFLANARIDDHTDFVVVTPGNSFKIAAPGLVTDDCFPVNSFSMSSVFTMAYLKADILGTPQKTAQYRNRYYSVSAAPVAFDSNILWNNGIPSTNANARRYYIGAMLGFIDPNGSPGLGNTTAETIAMIDRSAAADGTRPAGKFYFMNNTADPDRNVRVGEYTAAINAITAAGGQAQSIVGTLPLTKTDCLGIMSGFASDNIVGGNFTILPGAFCDHLTSWAARLDYANQSKVSEWIRKGASGSEGAVEEPCNYPGKFPDAKIHSNYFTGMSLGEAYFRSALYVPFQGLLYGDPLTRPFAYIPSVGLTGVPVGNASGAVVLTPSATTAHPSATIASFDLLIDGQLAASTTPGDVFTIDTTALDDGWHDLRTLAYDSSLIKTVGRSVGSITTSNYGRAVTLNASNPSGKLTTNYQFNVGASGGAVAEARILVNGRVVGSAPASGPILVRGMAFGPGAHLAQAEVLYTDGRRARSPRVPLTVAYASDPLSATAPVAFSYTKYVRNNGPFIVELPASYDNDPAGASYAIVAPPTTATITSATTRAFAVLTPIGTPCGTDTLTFRVTTPSGTSADATVTIAYLPPYRPCLSDYDNNGFVNGDDFDAFTADFYVGSTAADVDNNCFTNGDDFDLFAERFYVGC